jgi:hypothetical protein
LIRQRFPQAEVRLVDTVCKPTKERQSAAVEMASQADVVVVVGGRSSNNTRELVNTCSRYCGRVHHVETDADVRWEWFEGADVVGLTAGTSTPDSVIDAVEARIRDLVALCETPLGQATIRGRSRMTERVRWTIVVAFAIAMAWVEAASVLYIRALVDRIEPYQANPLPINGALGNVELWREASTLVMIAALGLLAGRTWRRRAGYAALAFGVWDIFYYVFLWLISGWPKSLLDWDILFLLPLPWWGPVLAPVTIALVMVVWGTLVTQAEEAAADARWTGALAGVGIVLGTRCFHD